MLLRKKTIKEKKRALERAELEKKNVKISHRTRTAEMIRTLK
jgi:hypothetical protein